MKDGEYAIYLGKEYTSGFIDDKILLRSTDINDVNIGFKPCEPFKIKGLEDEIVCLKYVNPDEVEEIYYLRTKAIYKGYKFSVGEEEEKDDMISIVAFTEDKLWQSLGMTSIDRGIYQKWINKNDAEIFIEKETYEE